MITADKIRVPNEKQSLNLSIGIMIFLTVILLGLSIGLLIIPLLLSVLYVKATQGQFLGNSVKVTENQFPEIYDMVSLASNNLSMVAPDVFIKQSPELNAFALGILGKKSVVLHSALVETMSSAELASIIGHEFTHIKCEHTTWSVIAGLHNSIPIPIVSNLLGFIFNQWSRKAEYTSDRGGLIVCQNLNASVSAMAKLAVGKELFKRLDLDILKQQKKQISQDEISKLSESLQTHPYTINRIQEIINFSNSSSYESLISNIDGYRTELNDEINSDEGNNFDSPPMTYDSFCIECGENMPSEYLICLNCGAIKNEES